MTDKERMQKLLKLARKVSPIKEFKHNMITPLLRAYESNRDESVERAYFQFVFDNATVLTCENYIMVELHGDRSDYFNEFDFSEWAYQVEKELNTINVPKEVTVDGRKYVLKEE